MTIWLFNLIYTYSFYMRCYYGVFGKLNNGLSNLFTFWSTHELFYMEKENVQMQ